MTFTQRYLFSKFSEQLHKEILGYFKQMFHIPQSSAFYINEIFCILIQSGQKENQDVRIEYLYGQQVQRREQRDKDMLAVEQDE